VAVCDRRMFRLNKPALTVRRYSMGHDVDHPRCATNYPVVSFCSTKRVVRLRPARLDS